MEKRIMYLDDDDYLFDCTAAMEGLDDETEEWMIEQYERKQTAKLTATETIHELQAFYLSGIVCCFGGQTCGEIQ
jgi:hypothetical protein